MELVGVKRELAARFRTVRQATVEFVGPLSAEDQMVQSCAEASPTKWHLAHTSWFFETFVLREFLQGYEAFHPEFHWLFNSYYNSLGEMPEKRLRASFSRPSLDQIKAYRSYVDAAVERLLGSEEVEDEVLRRVSLGLEHEQQHLELIATDIKHALWTNPLRPVYGEKRAEAGSPAARKDDTPGVEVRTPEYTGFAGGLVEIGVTPDAGDVRAFAFDNETPRHTVYLQPYRLANRLVTCGEYAAFLNDNGYTRPELWLSEGWSTMRAEGWQAPLYWRRDSETESGWSVYTLRGMVPLEEVMDTPVCHVSFFEAEAFARWAAIAEPGCRLPTEFEWEHAAASLGDAGWSRGKYAGERGAGDCGGSGPRWAGTDVWGCVGVDFIRVHRVSGVQASAGSAGGVQRQVHVFAGDSAGWIVCDAGVSYTSDLQELLSRWDALAVFGAEAGEGQYGAVNGSMVQ